MVVAKYAPSGFYIASGGTCPSARGFWMHVVWPDLPPSRVLDAWLGKAGGGVKGAGRKKVQEGGDGRWG